MEKVSIIHIKMCTDRANWSRIKHEEGSTQKNNHFLKATDIYYVVWIQQFEHEGALVPEFYIINRIP